MSIRARAICPGFRLRYTPVPFPERLGWGLPGSAIEIGDNVCVGANCTILKGARIGSGSIVATGAGVLGGEDPERSLLAGNPAKVVKTL